MVLALAPMNKSIYDQQYKTVLDILRARRQASGITQEELAKRIGETQSFVSKCERGERRLDVIELRAFCQALNTPFVSLVKEIEAKLGQ